MLSKTAKLFTTSLRLSKLATLSKLFPLKAASSIVYLHPTYKAFNSFSTRNKDDTTTSEEEFSSSEGEQESTTKFALENYNISPKTVQILKDKGINALFPIQAHTYEAIQSGRDVIARDATGSGKTLSYVLPMAEKFRNAGLFSNKRGQAPLAMVILPTRELATQVTNVFNSVKHNDSDYRVLTVYGGTDIRGQIDSIRKGCEFLVGTPGRIIDLIERGELDLSQLKSLVLDEADRMLDMGFAEDIERIYEGIESQVGTDNVQTMLHSATLPPWVYKVAKRYLEEQPLVIDLLKNKKVKMPDTVSHLAINCPVKKRYSTLADVVLCYGGQHARTIIFTETKKEANDILMEAGIRQECQVLHGDIPQEQREITFRGFREGKFKCLIATNVAARGLDIPEVDLIVQMDPPTEVETYIHRAGRTARAGKSGVCVTFYSNQSMDSLSQIEKKASFKFQKIGAPQPQEIIEASSRDIARGIENVPHDIVHLFSKISKGLIEELGAEEALSRALAIISGTTESLKQRSLITAHEGLVTYQLEVNEELINLQHARNMLRQTFPSTILGTIKEVQMFRDRMGAVFDVPVEVEEEFKKYMRNGEDGVTWKKTESLPDLADSFLRGERGYGDDNRRGGDRRGGDRYGGDRRGGSDRYGGDRRNSGGYGDRNDRNGGDRRMDRRDDRRDFGDRRGDRDFGGRRDSQGDFSRPRDDYQGRVQRDTAKNPDPLKIFVSKLDFAIEPEDLDDFFKDQGLNPSRTHVAKDPEGNSKGFGFVTFRDENEAREALKLNGQRLGGRSVMIAYANKSERPE